MSEEGINKQKSFFLNKEEEKFEQFFLKYHPILYRYGITVSSSEQLVEDCIQELFLYLYEKEIDLHSIKNIKAYLFIALRRKILAKKKLILTTPTQDTPPTIEQRIIAQEERKQKRELLKIHLNKLPWRQKEAVYLKFFNNLSAKEIGEIMGITPQVVSNTVYKAVKNLRATIFKSPIIPSLLHILTIF